MDDLVYLVAETYEQDAIGQPVPVETERAIWAHIQSVNRAEWATAGQIGLQPQLVVTTPLVNYDGEQIVRIGEGDGAQRYGVYRTYFGAGSDTIELYLERKAGI